MPTSNRIVTAESVPPTVKFGTPTVTAWFSETLTPYWIEEALSAQGDASASGRRKEVIFAVAASESFLVEWTRDDVFERNVKACAAYFLAREHQPVLERWKELPKNFEEVRLISAAPDFGSSKAWPEFTSLVSTRNALVHGSYSRPRATEGLSGKNPPLSPQDLLSKRPGWAVQVVARIALELCTAAGTPPPDWAIRHAPAAA